MYVEVLDLYRINDSPLFPAPSARDFELIQNKPYNNLSLQDQPLEVLFDYRGGLLYLENGAQVYRYDPSSEGGNGYTGLPVTDESVYIHHRGLMYKAQVRFIN